MGHFCLVKIIKAIVRRLCWAWQWHGHHLDWVWNNLGQVWPTTAPSNLHFFCSPFSSQLDRSQLDEMSNCGNLIRANDGGNAGKRFDLLTVLRRRPTLSCEQRDTSHSFLRTTTPPNHPPTLSFLRTQMCFCSEKIKISKNGIRTNLTSVE